MYKNTVSGKSLHRLRIVHLVNFVW